MSSKKNIQNPANRLRNAYLIALTLVALLSIFSQYFVKQSLKDQESDGRVINVAGRQRMLSQRLTKSMLILSIFTDSVEIQKRQKEFKEVLILWRKSHLALQNGDSSMQIPANFNSDSIKIAFQKISKNHDGMLESAQKIIENFGESNFKEVFAQESKSILENEGTFLKGMNLIVEMYEQESRKKVFFLEKIEIALTISTLLTLFLEGMFIFRPTVKSLSNYIKVLEQNDTLKVAEEELRQNLEEMKQINETIEILNKEKDLEHQHLLSKTKENEEILAEQNSYLEKQVKKRTLELQRNNEELAVINEEMHQVQEELVSQRDLLESKNSLLELYTQKVSKSIQAAQKIQQAMLPPRKKMQELFGEYFVFFKPKDIVSGDFWWANEIDGKKYLIIADCTGHGVSGAMLTMIGASLLDRIIQVSGILEPAEILEKLHEEIQHVLQQEQTKNSEGMDIAVMSWYYEYEECFLSFAAAKRPLWCMINRKLEQIAGSRRIIGGMWHYKKPFETKTINLNKGDSLYVASDGYADQNNKERKSFSEAKLLNVLQEIQDLPMETQKEILAEQLAEHMIGAEQRDDILVVGVRI